MWRQRPTPLSICNIPCRGLRPFLDLSGVVMTPECICFGRFYTFSTDIQMVPTFPHAQVQSRNVSTITSSTSAPWIRQTNLRCLSRWDLHLGRFAPYMCLLHLLMGFQSHPVVPLILNLFVPPPIKVDGTFTNDMVGVHTSYI